MTMLSPSARPIRLCTMPQIGFRPLFDDLSTEWGFYPGTQASGCCSALYCIVEAGRDAEETPEGIFAERSRGRISLEAEGKARLWVIAHAHSPSSHLI